MTSVLTPVLTAYAWSKLMRDVSRVSGHLQHVTQCWHQCGHLAYLLYVTQCGRQCVDTCCMWLGCGHLLDVTQFKGPMCKQLKHNSLRVHVLYKMACVIHTFMNSSFVHFNNCSVPFVKSKINIDQWINVLRKATVVHWTFFFETYMYICVYMT